MSEPLQSPETNEITAAIVGVMSTVHGVHKTGQHSQFRYASDADVIRACRSAMVDQGLVLVPHRKLPSYYDLAEGPVDPKAESRGKWPPSMRYRVDLVATFRCYHTSGQWVTVEVTGCGVDNADKSTYKAETGAFKYALRQLFCLPTGEDPEIEHGPVDIVAETGIEMARLQWFARKMKVPDPAKARDPHAFLDWLHREAPRALRKVLESTYGPGGARSMARELYGCDFDTVDVTCALGGKGLRWLAEQRDRDTGSPNGTREAPATEPVKTATPATPDDGWGPNPAPVGAALRSLGVTEAAARHFGPKVQDAPDAASDPKGHAEAVAAHIRDHCRKQWHAIRGKTTRGDPAPSRWGDTQRAAWTRAHYGVEGLSALSMSQTLDLLRRMGAAKTLEAREALFGMEREK